MALQNLRTYFTETNRNDFMDMLNLPCVVTEKVQASSFHVQCTPEGYNFFKSGKRQPLDKVDRTMVKYYETAIKYFSSIKDELKAEMPTDWKFGFDYMTDKKTIDIEYQQLPKNGLILTHIQVLNPMDNSLIKKVIRDPKVIYEWADKLEVQRPQVIFQGKLSSNQKDELVKILEMSSAEFNQTFENKSFTRTIYNIFNTSLNKTALNEDLDSNIDSLVLNFFDNKSSKNFKLTERQDQVTEARESSDMYQISILDLVEFFSGYDINQVELVSENADERYIEIISAMFNAYIEKNATKYVGVNFESADFASDNPSFSLNTTFLKNEKTIALVDNKVLAELYKIALGSFRKKRQKETSIINADLMEQINTLVENIENVVMVKNNESGLMSFKTYLNHQNLKSQISPISEEVTIETDITLEEKTIMTFDQFLSNI